PFVVGASTDVEIDRHANSPHPSSREGHHSTTWWSSSFLLSLILLSAHAVTSLVHLNSVPSTQMRCMITAKRRASATIARFMPRRLAICHAGALDAMVLAQGLGDCSGPPRRAWPASSRRHSAI